MKVNQKHVTIVLGILLTAAVATIVVLFVTTPWCTASVCAKKKLAALRNLPDHCVATARGMAKKVCSGSPPDAGPACCRDNWNTILGAIPNECANLGNSYCPDFWRGEGNVTDPRGPTKPVDPQCIKSFTGGQCTPSDVINKCCPRGGNITPCDNEAQQHCMGRFGPDDKPIPGGGGWYDPEQPRPDGGGYEPRPTPTPRPNPGGGGVDGGDKPPRPGGPGGNAAQFFETPAGKTVGGLALVLILGGLAFAIFTLMKKKKGRR